MYDILLPILNQTKDLFKTAQTNDKNLRDYQYSVKEMHRDLKRLSEKFEQFAAFNSKLNELQLNFKRLDDKFTGLRKTV